jgi:hypothetical protein
MRRTEDYMNAKSEILLYKSHKTGSKKKGGSRDLVSNEEAR